MSPSRTLLDFGAGLLIGLSITFVLFAAMEEDSVQLRHNMLLAALTASGLAVALIVAGRARSRRRRPLPPAGRMRDASAVAAGWTIKRPRSAVMEERVAVSSSNDHKASSNERSGATLPQLKAAHRNAQTAAEGDSRRL